MKELSNFLYLIDFLSTLDRKISVNCGKYKDSGVLV